ncbi:MAG TPA: histidine kinase [Opitutus sp.]|nr:histidine kinase [Opitutus sp.]
MKLRVRLLIGFLAGAASAGAAEHAWTRTRDLTTNLHFSRLIPTTVETSELRWSPVDDSRAAQPDWDDAAWSVVNFRGVPARRGILWLRLRLRDVDGALPGGLYLGAPLAYELYWDGVLIGRSGRPGNSRAEEVAGLSLNFVSIPPARRGPGEHVIALRASCYRTHYPGPTLPLQVFPMPEADWRWFNSRSSILPHMAVGAMLMVTVTSLVMWLVAARLPVLLLFTVLCACATAMQALAMAFWDYGYSYEWNYLAAVARGTATDGVGLSLVALTIVLFNLPRACWLAVVAAPLAGIPLHWFGPSAMRPLLTAALLLALAGAAWAMVRRRPGARPVAAGVLVTTGLWLRDPVHFIIADFFQGFLPTMLGLVAAVALQVRGARRKARDTQLAAARMEIELLKKNLQPHFMMNTLAALSDVVEREPASAVKLIDDLAGELRVLARISGEKLIPLGQELELCRSHLRVMSVRTEQAWSLATTGVDENVSVPPAVFLTLIENGFVHQRVAGGAGTFALTMDGADGVVRFGFFSPGEVLRDEERPDGGTGLRYVKARLEESFAGRWELRGEPVAGGWRTRITVPRATGGAVGS